MAVCGIKRVGWVGGSIGVTSGQLRRAEWQSAVMVVLGINSSWKVGWLGVPLGVTSGQLMPSPGGHGHHWIITLQLGFYGSLKGFCGTVTRFTRADLPKVVFGKYLNPVKRLWAKHQGGEE